MIMYMNKITDSSHENAKVAIYKRRFFLHSRMADYQEWSGLLVLTRQWGY